MPFSNWFVWPWTKTLLVEESEMLSIEIAAFAPAFVSVAPTPGLPSAACVKPVALVSVVTSAP